MIFYSRQRMSKPFLIIFSGLPGTGKTTLAKGLAARLNAVYLRADTIEKALVQGGIKDIGELGYRVGYATAKENLILGNIVIADSVNPWHLTREAWRQAAKDAGAPFIDVEIVCSDRLEHRRRIENREIDIAGLKPPAWQDVLDHDYHPWTDPPIQIDTAGRSIEEAMEELFQHILLP